jgi:hypothetical protein
MPGEHRLNSTSQKRWDRRSAAALAVSRRVDSPLQPLSPAEQAELLAACEADQRACFGVVRLAGKNLDEVVDGKTLLRHAAVLQRHAIVASLLRAGADATATACQCSTPRVSTARHVLKAAQPSFVAWLVSTLACAPTLPGARCAACDGGSGCRCPVLTGLFPCCSAAVCEPCFWACVIWDEAVDDRGDGLRCPACPPAARQTPEELLPEGAATSAISRAAWEALPETLPLAADSSHAGRRRKAEDLAPCSRREAACRRLGDMRAQRSTQLVIAVKSGRLLRVAALLRAGCDVETRSEDGGSGGTPLFLAAWRGRAAVVDLLLAAGVRADACDNAGVSAAEAAYAAGHHDMARTLAAASGGGPLRPPRSAPAPLSATLPRLTLCLPDCEESHPGAGAAYLDDAFSEEWLCELERLFSRLPTIAAAKPGGSTRSNFVDAPGWVSAGLAAALAAVRDIAPAECAMRTCSGCLPQLRFLSYAEKGSRLAPHVDLPKHRASDGAASTHTFILYLRGSGGDDGGETRLLRSASHPWPEEEGGDPPLASVAPRRGRLLLFPHACPHDGAEVRAPPKLLLRGEML